MENSDNGKTKQYTGWQPAEQRWLPGDHTIHPGRRKIWVYQSFCQFLAWHSGS